MKIVIFLILLTISLQAQSPITEPIKWTGLDKLSKYARTESISNKSLSAGGEGRGEVIYETPYLDEKHDKTQGKLIEDPRVKFSTYFGGNGYDCSYGLCVDSKDYIYISGYTGSSDLPTTEDAIQKSKSGGHDAFIAKFTQEGQPVWITYYGGSGTDVALDMVCDDEDNLIICGKTNSNNLPNSSNTFSGDVDAFILKMNEDGELLWSQYLGGERFESAEGIAILSDGFVITGYTNSKYFPSTDDAYQKENNFRVEKIDFISDDPDAFITRFAHDGNIVYSSFFGANDEVVAHAIATDENGNYAITGYMMGCTDFPVSENAFQKQPKGEEDCFIAKFNFQNEYEWSSLIGGNKRDKYYSLCSNNQIVHLCGESWSNDFPGASDSLKMETQEIQDIIVSSFSDNGQFIYSNYLGGTGGEDAQKIFNNKNSLWITGYTQSKDIPTSETALPNFYPDDDQPNIYLLQMNLDGIPEWVSYYSGGQNDFGYNVIVKNDHLFFTGETRSLKFPVSEDAFKDILSGDYSGFIVNVDISTISVKENNTGNSILIYPNPVKNILNIETILGQVSPIQPKIYNLLGNEIETKIILQNDSLISIDLSGIPKGFYYIQFLESENIYNSYPFIKR